MRRIFAVIITLVAVYVWLLAFVHLAMPLGTPRAESHPEALSAAPAAGRGP